MAALRKADAAELKQMWPSSVRLLGPLSRSDIDSGGPKTDCSTNSLGFHTVFERYSVALATSAVTSSLSIGGFAATWGGWVFGDRLGSDARLLRHDLFGGRRIYLDCESGGERALATVAGENHRTGDEEFHEGVSSAGQRGEHRA